MQTFLPYSDFEDTVKCLDDRRLGKQRVEAFQILKTLQFGSRWHHHPAVLMWTGYEESLKLYINTCIQEWIRRGCNNNMAQYKIDTQKLVHPYWLGGDMFHASHRSNLLRKNEEYYSRFCWKESNDLEYYWPVFWDGKLGKVIRRKKN